MTKWDKPTLKPKALKNYLQIKSSPVSTGRSWSHAKITSWWICYVPVWDCSNCYQWCGASQKTHFLLQGPPPPNLTPSFWPGPVLCLEIFRLAKSLEISAFFPFTVPSGCVMWKMQKALGWILGLYLSPGPYQLCELRTLLISLSLGFLICLSRDVVVR